MKTCNCLIPRPTSGMKCECGGTIRRYCIVCLDNYRQTPAVGRSGYYYYCRQHMPKPVKTAEVRG